MKTIAFFGHRQIFNKQLIEERLIKVIEEVIPQGFGRVLIGCHGDFDDIALSTCLDCKKTLFNKLSINVVLTSLTFLKKDEYGNSRVDTYKTKGCETLFYDVEGVYFKRRITFSNKKMVDESDLIICYVDMKEYKSGAKDIIEYALKQNKKIINLFQEN